MTQVTRLLLEWPLAAMNVTQVTPAQPLAGQRGDTAEQGCEEKVMLSAEIANADWMGVDGAAAEQQSLCARASVRVAPLGRPPCSINSSSCRSCNCQTDLSSPNLAMHSGVMVTLNCVSSPPSLCAPVFPRRGLPGTGSCFIPCLAYCLRVPGSSYEEKIGWAKTQAVKDGRVGGKDWKQSYNRQELSEGFTGDKFWCFVMLLPLLMNCLALFPWGMAMLPAPEAGRGHPPCSATSWSPSILSKFGWGWPPFSCSLFSQGMNGVVVMSCCKTQTELLRLIPQLELMVMGDCFHSQSWEWKKLIS